MMDHKIGYPAAAVHWHVDADHHSYPSAAFNAIVSAHGFRVLLHRSLTGVREELRPESLGGERILWSELVECRFLIVRRLDTDAIVMAEESHGDVTVSVASDDLAAARNILSELAKALPAAPIASERVLPLTFWYCGNDGPATTTRNVELVAWDTVASNYSASTNAALAALIESAAPAKDGGRLLLWHGAPGTGKTYAIRALAWAWRQWCRFECVTDPERLFDRGNYLMEVLLHDEEKDNKWRVLVLEDSGEMIGIDAKNRLGQGLSRLLNVSDGILGQGTKIMILITTNEDLGKLNPAIMRPGRCFSEVEFRRFDADEANQWLGGSGYDRRIEGQHTLSELFAIVNGRRYDPQTAKVGFRPEPCVLTGRAI
jgi:hypothetical protein